jgi:hypothetical protein
MPVTTCSPACTPVRISVPSVLTRPTTTGRVTVLPSWTTCTVGAAAEPPTAEDGTTSTLLRLAVVTLAWPVMSARAPLGSPAGSTVTWYSTTVLVPAELVACSAVPAMSLTWPVAVAPSKPSKVSSTAWPSLSLPMSSWLTSTSAARPDRGTRVASWPPAPTRSPTSTATESTSDPGG